MGTFSVWHWLIALLVVGLVLFGGTLRRSLGGSTPRQSQPQTATPPPAPGVSERAPPVPALRAAAAKVLVALAGCVLLDFLLRYLLAIGVQWLLDVELLLAFVLAFLGGACAIADDRLPRAFLARAWPEPLRVALIVVAEFAPAAALSALAVRSAPRVWSALSGQISIHDLPIPLEALPMAFVPVGIALLLWGMLARAARDADAELRRWSVISGLLLPLGFATLDPESVGRLIPVAAWLAAGIAAVAGGAPVALAALGAGAGCFAFDDIAMAGMAANRFSSAGGDVTIVAAALLVTLGVLYEGSPVFFAIANWAAARFGTENDALRWVAVAGSVGAASGVDGSDSRSALRAAASRLARSASAPARSGARAAGLLAMIGLLGPLCAGITLTAASAGIGIAQMMAAIAPVSVALIAALVIAAHLVAEPVRTAAPLRWRGFPFGAALQTAAVGVVFLGTLMFGLATAGEAAALAIGALIVLAPILGHREASTGSEGFLQRVGEAATAAGGVLLQFLSVILILIAATLTGLTDQLVGLLVGEPRINVFTYGATISSLAGALLGPFVAIPLVMGLTLPILSKLAFDPHLWIAEMFLSIAWGAMLRAGIEEHIKQTGAGAMRAFWPIMSALMPFTVTFVAALVAIEIFPGLVLRGEITEVSAAVIVVLPLLAVAGPIVLPPLWNALLGIPAGAFGRLYRNRP